MFKYLLKCIRWSRVGSGSRGGSDSVWFRLHHIDSIAPAFESRPGRLGSLVQNPDGIERREADDATADVVDVDSAVAIAMVIAAAAAGAVAAAVAGDSDFLEHTRLLAKFLEARVFFRTTVAQPGIR